MEHGSDIFIAIFIAHVSAITLSSLFFWYRRPLGFLFILFGFLAHRSWNGFDRKSYLQLELHSIA
jgi:hypothetical protein